MFTVVWEPCEGHVMLETLFVNKGFTVRRGRKVANGATQQHIAPHSKDPVFVYSD